MKRNPIFDICPKCQEKLKVCIVGRTKGFIKRICPICKTEYNIEQEFKISDCIKPTIKADKFSYMYAVSSERIKEDWNKYTSKTKELGIYTTKEEAYSKYVDWILNDASFPENCYKCKIVKRQIIIEVEE